MILWSLYDSKADTYTVPHVSLNEETAKRDFAMVVNDKNSKDSLISAHPEDFTLFLVGEWFDRVPTDDGRFTARLVASPCFKAICKGIDVKSRE